MKPIKNIINFHIIFYKEKPQPNTFGSNNISYDIYYNNGIMSVWKIGAFGDKYLINEFKNKNGKDITLQEMLENIEEISNMELEDFKKLIGESEVYN